MVIRAQFHLDIRDQPVIALQHAPPVAKLQCTRREPSERARLGDDGDMSHHVPHLASVGAGVHHHAATDRTRNAAGELQAPQPTGGRATGHPREECTGMGVAAIPLEVHTTEVLGDLHNHTPHSPIPHQKVAAFT